MIKVGFIVPNTGGSESGGEAIKDHNLLNNRNLENQHTIESITNLKETLELLRKINFDYKNKEELISSGLKDQDILYITKDNKFYRCNNGSYEELLSFAANPVIDIKNDVSGDLIAEYFNGDRKMFSGNSSLEIGTITTSMTDKESTVEINIIDNKISFDFKIQCGDSAYRIATNSGFKGTESEWLESLKGKNGIDGINGKDGSNGTNGINGKTAYQLAVDNGFAGTEKEWLTSLKGRNGADGINGKDGINGVDGKSAYQLATDNGFTGTEEEWLESLKGSSYNPSNMEVLQKLEESNGKLLFNKHFVNKLDNKIIISVKEPIDKELIIDLNQYEYDIRDVFIIKYNDAEAIFLKDIGLNTLYKIGSNHTVYKFVFNNIDKTISISVSNTISPPDSSVVSIIVNKEDWSLVDNEYMVSITTDFSDAVISFTSVNGIVEYTYFEITNNNLKIFSSINETLKITVIIKE